MPPAKKTTSRSTRRKPQSNNLTTASRAQLEKAIKRLEKSLDDARDALGSLGKDRGHGRVYKDLSKTLKGLRTDAQKANRSVTKELEKLRAAATPGRSSSRSTSSRRSTTRSSTARKTGTAARKTGTTARKTKTAAKSTARSGARKAGARTTASRSRRSS